MTIRAKFRCDNVSRYATYETVTLSPVTDSGIPEDQRFYAATPSGKIEFTVTNTGALGFYQPGLCYYVDMQVAAPQPG